MSQTNLLFVSHSLRSYRMDQTVTPRSKNPPSYLHRTSMSFLFQKFDRGKKQHEQGFNFQMKCRALMVHQSLRAKNEWVSKTSWDHVDLCVKRWVQQVSHCDVERSADHHRSRDVGRQTHHQTCTFRQCSALPTHQVPTW